jgi:ABC-type molybdate transport system ATPase subunit
MANIVQSLVLTGNTIRGVCYSKSDYLSHSIAELAAIPPERVGLHGEYDYYGLAKRIQVGFFDQVGRSAALRLSIKQRGSAVILSGQVDRLDQLHQLVDLALRTEGATHVEVQNVQITTVAAVPVQVA